MSVKIGLNQESVDALLALAQALPVAVNNIADATERLWQVFQSVSDKVGPHEPDFETMLVCIKKAQETAAEALITLPPMMAATANNISAYIANRKTAE